LLNAVQRLGHRRFSSEILALQSLPRSTDLAAVGPKSAVLARRRDNCGDKICSGFRATTYRFARRHSEFSNRTSWHHKLDSTKPLESGHRLLQRRSARPTLHSQRCLAPGLVRNLDRPCRRGRQHRRRHLGERDGGTRRGATRSEQPELQRREWEADLIAKRALGQAARTILGEECITLGGAGRRTARRLGR